MFTESVVSSTSRAPLAITSAALSTDILADSADLLDVAAALSVEFRRVIAELHRVPALPAPDVLDALTRLNRQHAGLTAALTGATEPPNGRDDPRTGGPYRGDGPPFVWARLVSAADRARHGRGVRAGSTVRAGWLDDAALRLLVAAARALGPGTEIHVIVPLDSREGTAARVRALCAGGAPDVTLTIDVQGGNGTSRGPSLRRTRWWRPSERASRDARSGGSGFRAGTWIVLDPALAS